MLWYGDLLILIAIFCVFLCVFRFSARACGERYARRGMIVYCGDIAELSTIMRNATLTYVGSSCYLHVPNWYTLRVARFFSMDLCPLFSPKNTGFIYRKRHLSYDISDFGIQLYDRASFTGSHQCQMNMPHTWLYIGHYADSSFPILAFSHHIIENKELFTPTEEVATLWFFDPEETSTLNNGRGEKQYVSQRTL